MRFLALIGLFFVLTYSSQSYAGFEWMPPKQQPAPTAPKVVPAPPSMPNAGFPAAPVTMQPLGNNAPMPITAPPAPARNVSGRGLYIDPYPLRNSNAPASQTSAPSVQQAMVEEARLLNPLPLGAGMNTGAQPMQANQPTASTGYRSGYKPRSPRAPMEEYRARNGMTPMIGGEPAPLPNVAMKNMAPPPSAPVRQYAQAVGFGRDLPLALALSQVIPSEYTHSFADNVDAGATVSWEGGKPWDQALNDMLRPKGMTAIIRGNQVMIQPLGRG